MTVKIIYRKRLCMSQLQVAYLVALRRKCPRSLRCRYSINSENDINEGLSEMWLIKISVLFSCMHTTKQNHVKDWFT